MSFGILTFRDEQATPAYLSQIRAEISRLESFEDNQSFPIGLDFLRHHALTIATELEDRSIGICNVTFKWRTHSRQYLKVPRSEVERLAVEAKLSGLVGVGLNGDDFYLTVFEATPFYKARQAEGRPLSRLPEVVVEADPVKVMVHLGDLLDGKVKLVGGEKVYS